MYVFGIHLSSVIYISIFCILIVFAVINLAINRQQKNRIYYIRFLLLMITGLIYNAVEELFPNDNLAIDLVSQYIIAYTVGLASAFYFLFYLSKEYNLKFVKRFNIVIIGFISFSTLIWLFIIPYSITKSLSLSRFLFLIIILTILIINITSVAKGQFHKLKINETRILKIHTINGFLGFLSIILFPITILASSGNQLIVQLCYTLGFYFVSIDYFLYPQRKNVSERIFYNISKREKEVLEVFLESPEQKFSEMCERLFISEKTFSVHMSSIYKKMQVKGKKNFTKSVKNNTLTVQQNNKTHNPSPQS